MGGIKKKASKRPKAKQRDKKADKGPKLLATPIDVEERQDEGQPLKVWLPGMPVEEGEQLEPDHSVYVMLHQFAVEWPCLSFDCIPESASTCGIFPMNARIVTGTQASEPTNNELLIVDWAKLGRTQYDESSDSEEDSKQEEPEMHVQRIPHMDGGVNRVRATRDGRLAASWSESGVVHIWDISSPNYFSDRLVFDCKHDREGFALAWSPQAALLTGDCNGQLCLLTPGPSSYSTTLLCSPHTSSIEDLQWSPEESTVFASASADGTVAIWDTRLPSRRPALHYRLHPVDCNVISWNPTVHYLMASGADDGAFSTWDLRRFLPSSSNATSSLNTLMTPIAQFDWHRAAITSIEWHPTDASVLAVSGADDQVTLWDFSAERDQAAYSSGIDDESGRMFDEEEAVPQQLLFAHYQRDVKELHWVPHQAGVIVSTGADGFDVFKTVSI